MNGSDTQLKEALAQLGAANKNLGDAYNTWGSTLTQMHIAEVDLREAKRRVASAYALVRAATPVTA